ncbi:hypothetical protein [Caenimonas aquaedulcis]|uniref:Pyrrolo-quinoline quinone n=1 Tax=Caenimonas aquaedulcis TaxID=2793270 RepID=A0A931MH27_9BURK|nr:hypothetical protein [Caenimonas aquaedulcis]MBG9388369.1 hypothetical protein [Caenimonas aquaedulcis]
MKKLVHVVAAVAASALLVACGGGAQDGRLAASASRAKQAAPGAQATAPMLDYIAALDWAPTAYPQYFSGASSDGYADIAGYGTFYYRYWPAQGNYVGILGDDVYVYGPMNGNTVQRVGALADFACRVYDCVASAPPPAWANFGRDERHTARSGVATQSLDRITWSTPVDLQPQYTSTGALLIHYGSPVVTARNTVIVPVKTGATDGFRIEAHAGGDGSLLWSADSDYVLPAHHWTPSYNIALTPGGLLLAPGAGGKLMVRSAPDAAQGAMQNVVFYGQAAYDANPAAFNQTIFINTPLTTDTRGNVYFGFIAAGANPAGLTSGLARIGPDGQGSWVSAAAAVGQAGIVKVATNSAPALSPDGSTVYVTFNGDPVPFVTQRGYLVALDSLTLAVKHKVLLTDPQSGTPARVSDDSTASPTVGPDGRVFFGVLETVFGAHNARGWLLQFSPQLVPTLSPGAFGWDDTASVIPAAMVPSYTGPSSYLLAVKYNNYAGTGTGDGDNRIAVIDPGVSEPDPISGIPVMKVVLAISGPTFESGTSGPVKEWCINTMAVDPLTRSILVNSEDGVLYRWDLVTNTLSQGIRLTEGLGEAYTPTAIGADGKVYAVNNARLYSVGR